MPSNANKQVTQAAAEVTGKRFCNDHQGEVALDAGCTVMRQKSHRWICFRCQENRKNAQRRPDQKSQHE